ncbi:MAG TPA: HNH endonuclease signature motif containing protein [Actinomycetota bacterium]
MALNLSSLPVLSSPPRLSRHLPKSAPASGVSSATGTITPETARRWACDASIARVITIGRSEPLEVGRRTPVVPASLRRAVVVRDCGCRFPGCDRPHGWCDAHHVQHWADGGPTSVSNLVLLCRPHHRLIHQRFGMEMVHGRPVFHRPDGSPLEDRAPPATCGR